MRSYFQILLLLGISLGYLVTADIQCNENWLLEGYQSDTCYSCKDYNDLLAWCTSYLNGESPDPIPCCHGYGYDYQDIMPDEGSTDTDVYDYGYEEYSYTDDYIPYEIEEYEDYEYYDSESDSDDEYFSGTDLMDDELAGPITNNEVLLPLPSSFDEFDSITITPPSLVDFTAPHDCILANILGNNYVDSYQLAKQKCTTELKEQLRLEFNTLLEQIYETKSNFETFLQQYSDELTEDELQEVRTQMSDLDQQLIERSQRMREQLLNPDCSKYTDIEKENSILSAAEAYERVLEQDEVQAGNEIFCLENYVRKLQTKLEECQYQVMSVYGQLFDEDKADVIYERMCRSGDVQRVKVIVNEFFTEVGYESTFPTPVIEPMYPEDMEDTADEMEQRRVEINRELEQLQQELDQAAFEKQVIFSKYVEVSNRLVYVEERINELQESGTFDSDEVSELSDEFLNLSSDQKNLKSELVIVNALISEIEGEMNTLLSEEIQLEMQLGVMPEQPEEETPDSPINEFINNMGPGPVQFQDAPSVTPEVEEASTQGPEEEIIIIVDDFPVENPDYDVIVDNIGLIRSEEGEHKGKLSKYLIGVLIGVLVLLGVLMLSLCIPLTVYMNRNKGKKVPYDKASLAEKDPAMLLKQTGFENPIYKFYVENSKCDIN